MKHFCPTHCFNYTGRVCPFCEKDRIGAYARCFSPALAINDKPNADDQIMESHKDDTPITPAMLESLKEKFNCFHKTK